MKEGVAMPVHPLVPESWTPPFASKVRLDFALGKHADGWVRHPVWGDPSFDTFKRIRTEPLHRGSPPYEWPVNGFLFEDPASGDWYAYIGLYARNYAIGPDKPPPACTVYRSEDRGHNWEHTGPIFDDDTFRFEGDKHTSNVAPDVSVVYADGVYHMAYDWCNDNVTWETAHRPSPDADAGVAYASAERPKGPWHRWKVPIIRNSHLHPRAILGRYDRSYGPTLIRRRDDWLVLTLVDTCPCCSWGMLAMTARDPKESWSEPTLVCSVEGEWYFPPIVEFFPAFCHEGFVYAPATSVAMNRSFQGVYRAPIEDAHLPEAWGIYQHGTVWHSEDVPAEKLGIFGQTFSGFVDSRGRLNALFPACDGDGLGSTNVVSRLWAQPIRERGFHLSAHKGPSLTLTRCAYRGFELQAQMQLRSTARVVWGHHAPVSSDRSTYDATLHPLSLGCHQAVDLSENTWRVLSVDATGKALVIAGGDLPRSHERKISVKRDEAGEFELVLDGKPTWSGRLPVVTGPLGLLLEPDNHVEVSEFSVSGMVLPAQFNYLYVEAFLGAGLLASDWDEAVSSAFRFGVGAVRREPGGRAKWNFRGQGFSLWSPRGPDHGRCRVKLDGRELGQIDLHHESVIPSGVVLSCQDTGEGYHALVMESASGRLVLDSLQVFD